MKKLTSRQSGNIAEAVTLICAIALVGVKFLFPERYHWQFWLSPALFYLYETIFVVLLRRFETMDPQKRTVILLAMRGVKFIGTAALMLVYMLVVKEGKNFFLIYTLFYYLITSLFETMAVAALNRPAEKSENKTESE